MSLSDFIKRAVAHGVEGVSIESFMLPDATPDGREDLRQLLDENGLERVWAWGHPRGLHSGTVPEELQNLCHHVDVAHTIGARTMRICAGAGAPRHGLGTSIEGCCCPFLKRRPTTLLASRSSWRSRTTSIC